ncbi:MAG: cyclic nucleotide-binding domain-containing protein [Trueperaceae bacterium]
MPHRSTTWVPRRAGRELIVPAVAVIVSGLMLAVRVAALAALIYAGMPDELRADGLSLALIGCAIAALWIALRSSMPGLHAAPSGVPAAVIAVGMATVLATQPPGTLSASALAIVTVTGASTGLVLLLMGMTGMGRLIRYLPHPVVGGVLAASGWVLIDFAMQMMARPIDAPTWDADAIVRWLPGVALGLWMVAFRRAMRHPAVVPAVLAVATAGFFAVARFNGWTHERLLNTGWLLGPFPDATLWRLPPVDRWLQADPQVLLGLLPMIATAAVSTGLLVALYSTAAELERDSEADPSVDLRETGIANLLGSTFAALPTVVSIATSSLSESMRARRRVDAALAALVTFGVVAIGPAALASVPLPILGGLLVMMGADFLVDWLVVGHRRLSGVDLSIVFAIVATVVFFGLLPGIGVGLALAVVLFVVLMSRTDVVKEPLGGQAIRSRVTRSAAARDLLQRERHRIALLRLDGVVFFGTADRLVERVKARLKGDPPPRFVVLDVAGASAFDATGGIAVVRIARAATRTGAEVVVVGAGPQVRIELRRAGAVVAIAEDLDRALERCETAILHEHPEVPTEPSLDDLVRDLPGGEDAWATLRPWFVATDVAKGEMVVRQGDPGDSFWIVEWGRVSAVLDTEEGRRIRLESVGTGQVLGEIAFVTGVPRSAHLVAEGPTRLLRMDRDAWERLAEEDPLPALALRELMMLLASRRVRHLTEALAGTRG